ncbi:MAG TPA: hypothetical protein VGD78_13775 [Chthoniobacterales bacterium]
MTTGWLRDTIARMDIARSSPLPVEVLTAPLRPDAEGASVSFGLVIQDRNGRPPFILLRQTLQASVYLGCLRDGAGLARQWVEVWAQDPARLRGALHPGLSRSTNHAMDELWQEQSRQLRELNPDRIFYTGWEDHPAAPLVVDVASRTAKPLQEPATSRELVLCTDDAFLQAAGQPTYRDSLHRFFWAGTASPGEPLYSFEDAAVGAGVHRLESGQVFNVAGGPLLLRPLAPLSLSEYAGLLSGKAWDSARLPEEVLARLPPTYARLQDEEEVVHGESFFLQARAGGEARVLETLFLKLNLFAQMIEQVERWTTRQQGPFLHLTPASFRVHLNETATGLPGFWAAHVDFAEPAAAWRVPLGQTDHPYFVTPTLLSASIYQPRSATVYHQATGTARVRELTSVDHGRTQVDLTLATTDPLAVTPGDLVHLTLAPHGTCVTLYGHPDRPKELSAGLVRIRTVPQALSTPERTALEQAAGLPLPDSPYEVLPGLSSPYDLYALVILGTEILWAGSDMPLAVVVDELLSLAVRVAADHNASVPLPARLERLLGREPRWLQSLGSRGVRAQGTSAEQGHGPVPLNLWAEVLALLLRMLPGAGPDSSCTGFGDAPVLALETAFHPGLRDLKLLQAKLKSILFGDAPQNAEMQEVLMELRRLPG